MTIETCAYARAGLLGNPSDQYFGKIIAVSVKNFSARVFLEESAEIRIEPSVQDEDVYRDVGEFLERLKLYGYYGGARLIKAAAKAFFDYCRSQNIEIEPRGFTLRYECDIPRQVGLAGSSAIIVAAARRCGASANFAGSGGSIVGICENENMFDRLSTALGKLGAKVIRPQVV